MHAATPDRVDIRFQCPSGHKLVADIRCQGHAMRCPKCGRAVVVPTPPREPLTETGIVRLLADQPNRSNLNIWT